MRPRSYNITMMCPSGALTEEFITYLFDVSHGVTGVVADKLNDHGQDLGLDIGERDLLGLISVSVFVDHGFDKFRHLRRRQRYVEAFAFARHKMNSSSVSHCVMKKVLGESVRSRDGAATIIQTSNPFGKLWKQVPRPTFPQSHLRCWFFHQSEAGKRYSLNFGPPDTHTHTHTHKANSHHVWS